MWYNWAVMSDVIKLRDPSTFTEKTSASDIKSEHSAIGVKGSSNPEKNE